MKRSSVIFLMLVASIPLTLFLTLAGSSDSTATPGLSWKSFDEGSSLAVQQKKKLLVDVYTDWCTWCKKMDKDVYASEDVKIILADKFVGVKLNAESTKKLRYQGSTISEREFSRSVGVTGYPTTLFFDENLKPITLLPGYVKPESFVQILTYIGEEHYKTTPYSEYINKLK